MGGSMCPPELLKMCTAVLGINQMTAAYGQTETSPASFACAPESPIEKRTTTCGSILAHTEAKIMETKYDEDEGCLVVKDDARVTPVGVQGEVWIRGYLVMMGYWKNPAKTAATITEDGWNKSGDLGFLDEDGYLTITGRIKDMIIRGGENIFPSEIEAALAKHENIFMASVIGQPDERLGEKVRAVIMLADKTKPITLEELREWCKPHLAAYKIPEFLDITESYPMTTTQKVIKGQLKKLFNTPI